MKKIIPAILILICFSTASFAQSKKAETPKADTTQPKILVLQGDIQAYQLLVSALDKSSESHQTVEALKTWIIKQIEPQINPPAEAKKP
jgi:hypothetical protein